MNCTDFNQELDDYLDGRLEAGRCERLLTHSLACRGCNTRLSLESLLRQRLRNLAPAPIPAGYATRVLRGAREATGADGERRQSDRRRQTTSWLNLGALAASVAVLAVLVLPEQQAAQLEAAPAIVAAVRPEATVAAVARPEPSREVTRESIRVVKVERGQTEPVKLVFRSPSALSGVTMELDLPAGIQLVGYPGRSRLSWQTNLLAGANVLELPVQVTGAGGVVTATVNLGGDRRSFSVLVQGAKARAEPAVTERAT